MQRELMRAYPGPSADAGGFRQPIRRPELSWLVLVLIALFGPASAGAVEQVKVMALFPGKAMVAIDGKRRLLRVGKQSPEGVMLISANARGAVIEVDGRLENYQLGASYGGNFVQPEVVEVRIPRTNNGAYLTVGSINGRTTDMLVDTGATSVAMSEPEAKRLGIQYRLNGRRSGVQTASGYSNAYAITLDRVRVGSIEMSGVEAVVIEGDSPRQVLLGMSFLKQVEMENQGALLILRNRF